MNNGTDSRGKDVSNAKNVFTLSDLGSERNSGFLGLTSFLWSLGQASVSCQTKWIEWAAYHFEYVDGQRRFRKTVNFEELSGSFHESEFDGVFSWGGLLLPVAVGDWGPRNPCYRFQLYHVQFHLPLLGHLNARYAATSSTVRVSRCEHSRNRLQIYHLTIADTRCLDVGPVIGTM